MQEFITFISNHTMLGFAVFIVLVFIILIEMARNKQGGAKLSPLQTTQKINHENAVIIDIRPNDAYRQGHIIDAYSITPQEINSNTKKLEKFKGRPIIIVCTAGIQSQKTTAFLLKQGYNAYTLAGGMRGWTEAQMPLIKE